MEDLKTDSNARTDCGQRMKSSFRIQTGKSWNPNLYGAHVFILKKIRTIRVTLVLQDEL